LSHDVTHEQERPLKWNKTAVIAVIVILSVSYMYSTIKRSQLSNDVEQGQLAACSEDEGRDCHLISEYHDECFDSSYRAEFRIRELRRGEYADCMSRKIGQHVGSTGN
jgi:hypothetical protein